jgi:hypothetical protein
VVLGQNANLVQCSKNLKQGACTIILFTVVIQHHLIDTIAGKQLSQAATDVLLTLMLKREQHLNID